ncbi:MAG: hypothetical protein Q4B58_04225 [Bacteroidales bacterium]|nr:hypothetical protein [Bacteroidales bacterium]
MKFINYIFILFVLLGVVSCDQQEGDDIAQTPVTLKLDLAIPFDGNADSRAMGDPGVEETFLRPTRLWVFLAVEQKTERYVYSVSFNMAENKWNLSEDNLSFSFESEKSCHFEGLDFAKNPVIRAYLIASHDPFSFSQNLVSPAADGQVTVQKITEEQLTRLTINAYNGSKYVSLRDVYSTPYNLNKNGKDMNVSGGTYYGTVDITGSRTITLKESLYHVAAKVDFQWNVESSNAQPNVAKSILIKNAPAVGYAFRPTERPSSSKFYSKLLLGEEEAEDSSDAVAVNPGNQWSGRACTYMFQPGWLEYKFTTVNNEAEGGYHGTADPDELVHGETADIFASWYKINISIKDSTIE